MDLGRAQVGRSKITKEAIELLIISGMVSASLPAGDMLNTGKYDKRKYSVFHNALLYCLSMRRISSTIAYGVFATVQSSQGHDFWIGQGDSELNIISEAQLLLWLRLIEKEHSLSPSSYTQAVFSDDPS
jgi:hypothetical protein